MEIILDSLSNSVLCFIHWCLLHERCYGCRCRSQHACSIVYPIKQTSSWANWFAIFFFRATRPTGWPLHQQQSVKPITLRSRTFPTKFTLLIFKNFHLTEKHCFTKNTAKVSLSHHLTLRNFNTHIKPHRSFQTPTHAQNYKKMTPHYKNVLKTRARPLVLWTCMWLYDVHCRFVHR